MWFEYHFLGIGFRIFQEETFDTHWLQLIIEKREITRFKKGQGAFYGYPPNCVPLNGKSTWNFIQPFALPSRSGYSSLSLILPAFRAASSGKACGPLAFRLANAAVDTHALAVK